MIVKARLKILILFIVPLIIIILYFLVKLPGFLMDTESENQVLKIHSPLNERIIIPIIKEFQESTGILTEYTSAGTLDLLHSLEDKGDKYLMDLMWGGSKEYLTIYEDLFEPLYYESSTEYTLGYNLLPIVLIYNRKLVSEEEVSRSWSDILQPKWKGRLALADPEGSGSAYIALSFLLELGMEEEYNWDNAAKLYYNVEGKMLSKSSEVYNGVADGDFAIGITMEEAAINLIHQGKDIGIVYLNEGTPVINDSIALMKDARHKEEAKAFIEFVLSKKVQTFMVDRFYLRSVRNDVRVPNGLSSMDELNIFDASNLSTFDNQEMILNKWRNIIADFDKMDL
ncbi:extracellular solute-binding protein [Oceanispirochaeta crateris]|uniref:Extracellular solute-binding protein n=1 Tax=Oceanispirochaeta crateris TaxID=2518645 RepID=A0A5C1QN79_9SPIO|nr:extracellular solute-binding protein [Oceanispirochaeta crateris]QEN08987.1 extracellular solute-binding protein [Oceanispirochaeta crateris]